MSMTRRAAISEGPFPSDPSDLILVGLVSASVPQQEGKGYWSISLRRIFVMPTG